MPKIASIKTPKAKYFLFLLTFANTCQYFFLKLPIAVLIPTYPFFNLFLLPKHFKLSQT